MEFSTAKQILAVFERHAVRYVLVGSMAMAAQGIIRATRDMHLFVSPDAANVDRLKAALWELFDDPQIETIRADELAGPYPAIQYVPPTGDFWIDIMARLGDTFRFADVESEELVVGDVHVRVATPRMLYRMKKNTVRPQDRVDAEVLRDRFKLEDV